MNLRVLYLFTGERGSHLAKVKEGKEQGNGYWGMLRLHAFGVDANFVELEHFLPKSVAIFLRKHIFSAYWMHLPLYPLFFVYDIIFTSSSYGTQLVHTIFHFRKPRWIMHDFSIMGLLGNEKKFPQKIFAWMVSRSAGIVTISLPEAEDLKKRFPHLKEKIAFIPYGVDLDYFKPQGNEVAGIFAPGRDPDRDLKTLFKAAEGLGVGVLVTTHASRLEKLRPLPSFVVHRTLSVEELKEEYAKAKVVVIPLDTSTGLNNAMGISALYEALAMGKAIVATRTEAMESYITDGVNGLLVEEGSVEAMGEALSRVVTDAQLRSRLERGARAYAEAHLDADACTKKLAEYFEKVVV